MSQSNSAPTDASASAPPSSAAPEIITVRTITANQQTSQDSTPLPLSLPTTSTSSSNAATRENARALQPFASASSSLARTKSPLRQSSVASLNEGPLPPGVIRVPRQPVSSSSARIGSSASNAAVAANLDASTASTRAQPAHQRLPGSAGTVYVSAMHSSPAPMSFSGSPPLPPGFQPYSSGPSAAPLPPSQPPLFFRPSLPRSRSDNIYPSNQSSQSLATPGMAPTFSGMRPQSSPSYYPTYAGSPNSRINQTSSSSSQRLRPGFSPSNMPPLIPPVPIIPDPPSQRPGSYGTYASQAPMNTESYPPGTSPEYVYRRTPSRRPTVDAYVANDPFRPNSQKNTAPVDNNVTFDDIPVSPPEESYTSRRYMTPSESRPNTVSAPPAPMPFYPGQTLVASENVPPVPIPVYSGQTPVASEYIKKYPSFYRPTTGSGQSASSPWQPAPMYDATLPLRTPFSQVDSQRSEYPPTYVSVDDPGRIINPNQGNSGGDTPGSPIRTSDPAQSTIIEVDEPQRDDGDSPAGADQAPRPPRWNPDVPLVPVRRPTDESWVDAHPYDYHPADTENMYMSPYLPFPDNNIYMGHMAPVSNDMGFWSRVGGLFGALLPKKSRFDYAPPIELESQRGRYRAAAAFVGKTLPQQIYLHLLLRLPSLYFSRVARIFEEADLTLPEIKKMALETASQGSPDSFDALSFEVGITAVPPQYERLKTTWESFIDSVMREWKTFNIISVLLLSCVPF